MHKGSYNKICRQVLIGIYIYLLMDEMHLFLFLSLSLVTCEFGEVREMCSDIGLINVQ